MVGEPAPNTTRLPFTTIPERVISVKGVGTISNSSESVFFKKKFYFSVEARYNTGVGLWQFAQQVTNT